MNKKLTFKIIIAVIAVLIFMFQSQLIYAKDSGIEDVKSCVVEICSGIENQSQSFNTIKYTSGFIVTNNSEGAYIITSNHSITVSEKEKKQFCSNMGIKYEEGQATAIKVIVNGDVFSDLSVVAQSEKEDYCVLKANDVISERKAVIFGNVSEQTIGEKVYAFGFPEGGSSSAFLKYDSSEVEIHEGEIQDNQAKVDGIEYIQHSSVIDNGNSGGPLVDKKGNVIGMNNNKKTDSTINAYYSLSAERIKKILDNFNIDYNSVEKKSENKKLNDLIEECNSLVDDNTYTSKSRYQLKEVLQEVNSSTSDVELTYDDIENTIEKLEKAKQELELDTSTSVTVIWVLAGTIVILILLFIKFYHENRKAEKIGLIEFDQKENDEKENDEKEIEDTEVDSNTKRFSESIYLGDKQNKKYVGNDIVTGVSSEFINEKNNDKTLLISDFDEFDESEFQKRNDKAQLKQIRNGRRFKLDKREVVIGKVSEMVDIDIQDNRAVSRVHATIKWKNERYYLYDLNSSNGTFLNGQKIGTDAVELNDEDIISIANESFVFEII